LNPYKADCDIGHRVRTRHNTDVWVDATTGKITPVEAETAITEMKEVAEQKAKKWPSHYNAH
jgi:hypothetical protein